MTETLSTRMVRALKWSYGFSLLNIVSQIAITATLARLVDPVAFGLVAMSHILLRFVSYFAGFGIETAVIQKPELTAQDRRAAFTVSVGLGIVFGGAVYLLAPLAVLLFDAPALAPVLRALALSVVLTGLSATASALLKRELRFREIVAVEVLSFIFSYGVIGIPMAVAGHGVWALVAAVLFRQVLVTSALFALVRHPVLPFFGRESVVGLASFGGRTSLLNFLEYIGHNVDMFVVGRVWGAGALGLYTRAFATVNLTIQNLTTPFLNMLLPTFSRAQKRPEQLCKAASSALLVVFLVAAPIAFGVLPAAEHLVLTLLGPQWTDSVPVLRILALSLPFVMGSSVATNVFMARGRLGTSIALQCGFIIGLAATAISAAPYGIEAIAVCFTAAQIARFFALQWLLRRELGFTLADTAKALVPGLLVAAASTTAIAGCAMVVVALPSYFALIAEIATGALTVCVVALFPPKLLRQRLVDTVRWLSASTGERGPFARAVDWYAIRITAE